MSEIHIDRVEPLLVLSSHLGAVRRVSKVEMVGPSQDDKGGVAWCSWLDLRIFYQFGPTCVSLFLRLRHIGINLSNSVRPPFHGFMFNTLNVSCSLLHVFPATYSHVSSDGHHVIFACGSDASIGFGFMFCPFIAIEAPEKSSIPTRSLPYYRLSKRVVSFSSSNFSIHVEDSRLCIRGIRQGTITKHFHYSPRYLTCPSSPRVGLLI